MDQPAANIATDASEHQQHLPMSEESPTGKGTSVQNASGQTTSETSTIEQYLDTGSELLKQDQVADAKEQFLRALAIDNDSDRVLSLLGLTYFRLSAFEDALPVYTKLVEKFPDDPSHRLNLGLVCLRLNQVPSAIAALEQTRKMDPNFTRTASYLALAYARNGQYGKAYKLFLEAGQLSLASEMQRHLTELERANIGQSPPKPTENAVDEFLQPDEEEGKTTLDLVDHALAYATPSTATTEQEPAVRTSGAITLSAFATERLIRPDESRQAFTIQSEGSLVIRVNGKLMSRTQGVISSGGDLNYEPALRRMRGATAAQPFSNQKLPLFVVSGQGHLVISPMQHKFTPVLLEDDILYLREDFVFSFEDQLRWENGYVPGSRSAMPMVRFCGKGQVVLRTKTPLLSIKVTTAEPSYVDSRFLAGWVGRVVPRAIAPESGGDALDPFVECMGEGVVLITDVPTNLSPGN